MARFSFYDVSVTVLSFITYVADLGTDIWLVVYFFSQGYQIWGSLTLAFIALATLVMEIFSFHWHVTDRTVTPTVFIIHILFLAPFHRYIQVIRHGLKSRETGKQEDIDRAFREVNDVCILRLFETFLEAAPQVVLQLYIILSDFKSTGYVVGVSMLFSLLSLSWAVTAYTDALHLAYKKLYKRTGLSLCAHLVWQTGMISARVLAIVLFAVAFNAFVAIPLVAHVVIMTLWILLIKPEFGSTPCERNLFVVISSLIHVFCFLNLKDSQSRWRMMFFYGVTLVENTVFVTLWYFFQPSNSPDWLDIVAFTVVFGGFALGCAGMMIYYGCCHPSGPSPIPALKPEFHRHPPQQQQQQPKPYNKRQYLELPQKSNFPKLDESSRSARINLWLHASLDLSKEGLVENPIDHLDTPRAEQNWSHNYDKSPRSVPYRPPPEGHESAVLDVGRPFSDSGVHVLTPNSISLADRSRSYLQRSEDRLDYTLEQQTAKYQYGEPSMSDRSLVEMFSRCKLDPSFVSTGSLNDSGVCQSKTDESAYNSRQGDSSGTSGYRTSMSTTSPGYQSANYSAYNKSGVNGTLPHMAGSGNSINSQNDYANYATIDHSISEIYPAKISPLDANKLWQEYSESMACPSDSDLTMSKNISTDVSFTPDYLRGIGRLSLSYSCLSEPGNRSNPQQYHSLTDTASFYAKRPHDSRGSMGSSLNNSQGVVSFSNLSLQLPDSSYNKQKPRRHNKTLSPNNGGSYGDMQNQSKGTGSNRHLHDMTVTKDSSLSDKQSSFLSDRCLSSSDQGLSSMGSVVERSHRSLTSSGFQSEESNTTELSPLYHPLACQKDYQNMYHQSTPIIENEISTIYSLPSTIRAAKRESMDTDVCLPGRASLDHTPYSGTSSRIDSKMAPTSALFGTNKADVSSNLPSSRLESPESLSLPPLTIRSRSSSSDRSSRSGGRFFKDPLSDEGRSHSDLSDEGSCPSSLCSNKSENSLRLEKSSVSAIISNLSSSQHSANSSGSISLNSSVTPPLNKSGQNNSTLKELYNSLPTSVNIEPPLYQNIEDFSPQSNASHSFSDSNTSSNSLSRNSSRLDYLTKDPSEQSKIMELLAEMSSMSGGGKPDYMNIDELSPQQVSNMEDSPHGLRRSIDKFDRDRLRASLDKQERDKLVQDIENMAPKKLYKLKTKAGEPKKKMSPMKISNYTDSPYKFRKPASSGSNYENITNSSPSSLGSGYEGMKALTPALYTDYVNVYDVSDARTGICPIATPESLSDTVTLDGDTFNVLPQTSDDSSDVCGQTFNVPVGIMSGEFEMIDNLSNRSLELSRNKSPINTSGYNSAFKPVKPRSSSSSNSTDIDVSSNISGCSGNRSSSSSDRSMMSDCGDFKKPRPVNPYNNSTSMIDESSSFRWSKGSSQDSTGEPSEYSHNPMNYLELVGKDPLSFTMSKYPTEETMSVSSSKHSYTDSIPWEDSINRSENFNSSQPAEYSARKSTGRPALKSLENTPVISPIYGGQSAKADELSCRKRFMSTPKISGNEALSVSNTTGHDSQLSYHSNTPKRDSYMRNKTLNNTSTWSSQSDQPDNSSRNFLNESHFSSLSKTTYI